MAQLAHRRRECPECGSDEFEETDAGAMVCLECGHQLHGIVAEVNEANVATFGSSGLGVFLLLVWMSS